MRNGSDIHSHIVWGVDDGPDSMQGSLAILVAARQSGTSDIVATPHANPEYSFQRELALRRIAELQEATGNHPRIHFGCEFHLCFDNIDRLMSNLRAYTINGRQYLLVECPDSHIGSHIDKLLRQIVDEGIVPIIAHPERNPLLRQKLSRIEGWVETGCLLQLTGASIMGDFGAAARTASHQLLDRGLAHLVASDSHDSQNRHPRLDEVHREVESRWGEEAAEILFIENPAAVIYGSPIPGGTQMVWRRQAKWYHLWKS